MSDMQKYLPGLGKIKLDSKDIGIFVSAVQTGAAGAMNIPHTLGKVPSQVLVVPVDTSSDGVFTVTEGTHTSTNIVVTVTATKKFKVLALL